MAKSFEELNVYQKARKLTNEIYASTRKSPFSKDQALTDQIRRASVSVMSNIAEGFERGPGRNSSGFYSLQMVLAEKFAHNLKSRGIKAIFRTRITCDSVKSPGPSVE